MLNDNKTICESQTVLFSVYVLWCNKTNMHYVGVTGQTVYRRVRQHIRGKRQFLDLEIQKIGWEGNFDWWVVESHVPANLISECEKKWIQLFDCVYPKGYNKTCGGISNITMSEDSCEKIRQKALARNMSGENNPFYGKHHSKEYIETLKSRRGENSPCFGKKRTEEQKAKMRGRKLSNKTRDNMRKAHLGKPLTEEHKAKLRGKKRTEEQKAKMRGRKLTEEHKAKLREAHTGKKRSEETKAKIRKKLTGRKLTEKQKAALRKANTGRKCSEKTRAILREKALARHAAKRAAKAVAEENLAATNSTPTSLSTLLDAVIFQ